MTLSLKKENVKENVLLSYILIIMNYTFKIYFDKIKRIFFFGTIKKFTQTTNNV